MGIDVRWRDEVEKDLGLVEDLRNVFSRHVRSSEWSHTICLRFIDPYGDTIFNQRQIPVLVQELEASLTLVPDSVASEHIAIVLEMLRRAADQVRLRRAGGRRRSRHSSGSCSWLRQVDRPDSEVGQAR
jgi:hypothetical protein